MAGYEDGDTPVPQQGHAFISYVREDSGAVDALQRSLEAAGVPVWRDRASLWPGEDWRAKIKEAITRDALVFIACFSSHTAARQKSHFYEELLLAIEQLRLRRPHDLWLIPVRLDDCEVPELELGPGRTLTSIQQADLFGEKRDLATRRLVAVVQRRLGQSAARPAEGPAVELPPLSATSVVPAPDADGFCPHPEPPPVHLPPPTDSTRANADSGTRRTGSSHSPPAPAPTPIDGECRARYQYPPRKARRQRSFPTWRRGRPTRVGTAIGVTIVAGGLALVIAALLNPPSPGPTALLSGDSGQLRLVPELLVDRSWQISGSSDSQYSDTLTIRNPSGKTVRATLTEPVSQVTIPFIKAARFSPQAPKISEEGLMLAWPVCVPGHGVIKTRYQITAAGIDLSVAMSMQSSMSADLSNLRASIAAIEGSETTPPPEGPTAAPTVSSLSVLAGPAC